MTFVVLIFTFRDSCVSLELTLDLPQAFRVCCCFQGLIRAFLRGPVLVGAQQWLSFTGPRHFPCLWAPLTESQDHPHAHGDIGSQAKLVQGQDWGEGSFWRLLMGAWAWPHWVPPQPLSLLQLKQVRKKQQVPSKPVPNSSKLILSLGKGLIILLSSKSIFGKKAGEALLPRAKPVRHVARAQEGKARGESMPPVAPSSRHCRHHFLCWSENHTCTSLQHSQKPPQIPAQVSSTPLLWHAQGNHVVPSTVHWNAVLRQKVIASKLYKWLCRAVQFSIYKYLGTSL